MRRVALALCATTTLVSSAALANDPGRGEQLARRWCAGCHLVTPGQQRTTEAPPFETIARSQVYTPQSLAFFLLDPHPKMPNMSLTRSEASDLAAYIMSLRK